MSVHSAAPDPRRSHASSNDALSIDEHASHADQVSFERVMGSRRLWRRLARRATAAHQRELEALIREVAAAALAVRTAMTYPLRGNGPAAVVTLALTLAGWELELGGVSAEAADRVLLASTGAMHLTRSGRYGIFWWIELSGDEAMVLLGSTLRLSATGGGSSDAVPFEPVPALAAGPG
jgi:hypothetical protein